jgi:glycogen debranching enzyme
MIQFEREACRDVEAALQREWLETNGLGGFASSTIIGLNTRRYHGLLVAASKPPVGRLVLLSKFEETLFIDGKSFDLSANHYPGVIHPCFTERVVQFKSFNRRFLSLRERFLGGHHGVLPVTQQSICVG